MAIAFIVFMIVWGPSVLWLTWNQNNYTRAYRASFRGGIYKVVDAKPIVVGIFLVLILAPVIALIMLKDAIKLQGEK